MDARSGSLAATGLDQSALEALSGAQAAANVGIAKSIEGIAQRQAVLESFAWSMRNMFIMYTALAAVAMGASVFIRHSTLKTEHSETITGLDQLKKAAEPSR
jgi:Ca2+/H+ antiporter